MRFHPRHYILLALLVALAIWNGIRWTRARHAASVTSTAQGTPAWQAFDRAASLRDAPDAQFTPALNDLKAQTDAAAAPDAADLRGCQMWLLYYRHSVPMASGKPGDWAMLATSHVHSCMTNHRDIGH